MPTYEYTCSKCGRFEFFQKMSDEPLQACPTCGGSVRRLISASAGILFKGSGFHTTDYRSSDYEKRAKEEKAPSAAKDAKPEGKTETKPKTESASKAS